MDLTTMNDQSFDLSDDFFDALSVIGTANPDFADAQQQQPNPQMITQCLIEDQQQRPQVATQQLQFAPQQPQSSPRLQQQQLNYHQQQQLTFRQQQQQQMMQQVAYQQQCQQSVIQQQRIFATYQQQQQQQYRSSPPAQNQHPQAPRNFVPQQQQQPQQSPVHQSEPQQQTTAQQRLFLQQQQSQLRKEQSHALQLASQLQYQQTQNKQLPNLVQPASHLQNQQPQTRQSTSPLQYQQTQIQNQQSRAIQLASQLRIQQQPAHQSAQLQIRSQQSHAPQSVSQLQQQQPQVRGQLPNVAVLSSQLPQVQPLQAQQQQQQQQKLPSKRPVKAQLPISQPQTQQPMIQPTSQIQRSTSPGQRLLAAHKQQQQQQPQNLATKQRKTVAPQNTFPTVSQQQTATTTTTSVSERVAPHVEIVEQPAPHASRFRYNCEVRDSGSIPGVNSTPSTKTYPTIRIVGYNGNAKVVVSCVTKDPPYRPHPHNLVGKTWCKNGICTTALTSNCMSVTFDRLGIQCIKRKDFPGSLEQREKQQVDPFGTGFEHKEKDKLASIDQNCVRLAFQVFLEGPKKGEFKISLPAIVSNPIHDKKNSPDLTIHKMSHCSAPAGGDLEMILLCDRVVKEDIRIRFYEERDEEVVWEKFVDVSRTGAVHKYVAIVFESPRYHELDFFGTIHAKVELVRPSDGMYSNSLPFDFTPENEPIVMKKKRKRLHESLVTRDLEAASNYSDQWSAMSHSNFNIIEAR